VDSLFIGAFIYITVATACIFYWKMFILRLRTTAIDTAA